MREKICRDEEWPDRKLTVPCTKGLALVPLNPTRATKNGGRDWGEKAK